MAVTQILAPGTTAANSSDVTVTTTPVTISLYTAAGGALPPGVSCKITKTNPSATYSDTGYVLAVSSNPVTGETQAVRTLASPGVYRVERPLLTGVTPVAVGVAQDT